MIYTFEIKGSIPSKKNSKQIIQIKGRPVIISSKNYLDWEREQLLLIKWNKEPLEKIKSITCKFTSVDNRKWDLSNKFESIADMFVKKGILKDDNYSVIPKVNLEFLCVNKEYAGCHIIIEE